MSQFVALPPLSPLCHWQHTCAVVPVIIMGWISMRICWVFALTSSQIHLLFLFKAAGCLQLLDIGAVYNWKRCLQCFPSLITNIICKSYMQTMFSCTVFRRNILHKLYCESVNNATTLKLKRLACKRSISPRITWERTKPLTWKKKANMGPECTKSSQWCWISPSLLPGLLQKVHLQKELGEGKKRF